MDFITVIILSIIEGITEFLPISSTGHLILASEYFKLEPESFANAFMIIIQLGAILAVVVVNFWKLYPLCKCYLPEKLLKNYDSFNLQTKIYYQLKYPSKDILNLWKKIIVAVIPAVVLGLLFDDIVDKYLFNSLVVSIALIFWGIVIIVMEIRNKDKNFKINDFEELSYLDAFKIGMFQCLALLMPGTSRSAATIIGGSVIGASRTVATDFSFYLAIPTMLGATALKLIKNLSGFTTQQIMLILLGSVLSFIVAYFTIKLFLDYVKKHDFKAFGYYRIVLGIISLILFNL